jgi:ankyrin repeat domain-containing protein 50
MRILRMTFLAAFLTEVLDWLSTIDPSANHNLARKAHQPQTGSWFLESHDYTSWRKNPDSPIWLHGLPGAGKAALCSTVIEEIKQKSEAFRDARCASFYFDFRDRSKQTVEGMLRSLLRQLSSFETSLPISVADLHRAQARQGHQPTQEGLVETLYSISEPTDRNFIVIDAFDECAELDEALDLLIALTDNSHTKLSVLVTSRESDDIGEAIKDVPLDKVMRMSIQNRKDNANIDPFIRTQVEKSCKLRRLRNQKSQVITYTTEPLRTC